MFEQRDKTFLKYDRANEFVSKYKLSNNEIEIIGSWYVNDIDYKHNDKDYGLGIGITFYPNRIVEIYQHHTESQMPSYIFGEWKVKNKKLYVKLSKCFIGNINREYRIVKTNETKYKCISNKLNYPVCYVNDEPYLMTAFTREEKEEYNICILDQPRYRVIEAELDTRLDKIMLNNNVVDILLNQSIEKNDNYYLELIKQI
jgi:hypothetical protein